MSFRCKFTLFYFGSIFFCKNESKASYLSRDISTNISMHYFIYGLDFIRAQHRMRTGRRDLTLNSGAFSLRINAYWCPRILSNNGRWCEWSQEHPRQPGASEICWRRSHRSEWPILESVAWIQTCKEINEVSHFEYWIKILVFNLIVWSFPTLSLFQSRL